MGLGNLVKDVLSFGGTARRRNRRARRERQEADAMIAENTALAQQMFDRDRGATSFTGMTADPALVAAQRGSLEEMQARSRDGYTDLDRQAMTQQLGDVARYEQGQRASLTADARARGVTGSGMDIASQLLAQQAGADRAMQVGTDMALAGRDRAYAANADAANLAASMRGQDWNERAQVASAQDQYRQYTLDSQGNDAAMLMNARGGHAQNLNDRAAQRENAFNEGVDQAVQVGGAIYGGFAGGGGGGASRAAAPAPNRFGHGATTAPFAGGNYKTGAAPGTGAGTAPPARAGLGRRPLSAARRRGPALLPTGGTNGR